MRTTGHAEDYLYGHIKGSDLEETCNGGLWKWRRPDASEKEDIVINSLPVTGSTIQRMSANVNIYVKDIPVPGSENHMIADTARLKQLAGLAMPLLNEFRGGDYDFFLVSQTTFPAPEIGQHYLNFRIDFELFNV